MKDTEISPEELQALKEKAAKADQLEADLVKEREKDKNFSRFRAKTAKEQGEYEEHIKQKLEKEGDEQQIFLWNELQRVSKTNETIIEEKKKEKLYHIAGGDQELAEKIEAEFNRLGNPITPAQIEAQYEEAKVLVEFKENRKINPLNTFVPSSSTSAGQIPKTKKFDTTDDGKAFMRNLGIADPDKIPNPYFP